MIVPEELMVAANSLRRSHGPRVPKKLAKPLRRVAILRRLRESETLFRECKPARSVGLNRVTVELYNAFK